MKAPRSDGETHLNGEPRIAGCPRVEIVDLGAWGGIDLLAEYDSEADSIRINTRAVERVRDALGTIAAERFIACAIAHERFHRAHPRASEADAHRFAAAATEVDPRRFEALFGHE